MDYNNYFNIGNKSVLQTELSDSVINNKNTDIMYPLSDGSALIVEKTKDYRILTREWKLQIILITNNARVIYILNEIRKCKLSDYD